MGVCIDTLVTLNAMVVPDSRLSHARCGLVVASNKFVENAAFLELTIPSFVKTSRIVSTILGMASAWEKGKLNSSRTYSIHLKHIHPNFERIAKGKKSAYPSLVFESKPETN